MYAVVAYKNLDNHLETPTSGVGRCDISGGSAWALIRPDGAGSLSQRMVWRRAKRERERERERDMSWDKGFSPSKEGCKIFSKFACKPAAPETMQMTDARVSQIQMHESQSGRTGPDLSVCVGPDTRRSRSERGGPGLSVCVQPDTRPVSENNENNLSVNSRARRTLCLSA